MDQFYREIDQAYRAGKLRYNAPLPLKHYYKQEQNNGFRGITIYKFPNYSISEVLQILDPNHNQHIGIVFDMGYDWIKYDNYRIVSIIHHEKTIRYQYVNGNNINIMKMDMNNQLRNISKYNTSNDCIITFDNNKPIQYNINGRVKNVKRSVTKL